MGRAGLPLQHQGGSLLFSQAPMTLGAPRRGLPHLSLSSASTGSSWECYWLLQGPHVGQPNIPGQISRFLGNFSSVLWGDIWHVNIFPGISGNSCCCEMLWTSTAYAPFSAWHPIRPGQIYYWGQVFLLPFLTENKETACWCLLKGIDLCEVPSLDLANGYGKIP